MYETIDRKELEEKLANDDIKLIEVLGEEEYERKHIEGAINVPLSEIGKEIKGRFESDQDIVVYCADSECGASPKAAEKLDQFGFENVYDYEGGKKDWQEEGNPMSGGEKPVT
ncbi:rhodanese-like domain-containing protein [Candidatus Bipolaricaulota bacterium]|nr:rhodanese-like domain-containing protein [Candidatus Bipolaricaulota bacterium]